MFGYVLPNSSTLLPRDLTMFQSAYCGLCLSIKHRYGNIARFTTNYDITVLTLLALETLKPTVEFETGRCICELRKKVNIKDCEFLQNLTDVNILLCWAKIADDEIDGGGKKRLVRSFLKKSYQKAKSLRPESDMIIHDGYEKLRAMEQANIASLDRTSDCFATLLEKLYYDIVKENTELDANYLYNMGRLCYNIGKFVYLSDALDDLEEDFCKKRYNPILAVYPDYQKGRRLEYIDRHHDELKFAITSTINRAIECSNNLVFTHVNDLLRNIICEGLREKVNELFSAKKKIPPPVLRMPKKNKQKNKSTASRQ